MKRYEILKSLPAYGPMYISISESGKQKHSEGFVVRFYKDDGTDWVANFETGWSGLDNVFDFPDKNIIVVFAGGIGYVMDPNKEKPLMTLDSMVNEVFQSQMGNLICIDDIGIQIFDIHTREIWISERISWDGFKDLTFENGILKGQSFDPTNPINEWVDLSFNTHNKEISGGSWKAILNQNPHLEMKNRIEVKLNNKEKKPWWKLWL